LSTLINVSEFILFTILILAITNVIL
jgi:hypothetical protein